MQPMKQMAQTKLKQGFTLLEILLTLGVISALTGGVFYGYKQYEARSQTSQAVADSRQLSNSLMQTYGQAGSFASLDTASVVNGRLLPQDVTVSSNQPKNAWGGGLTVAPGDANNSSFAITWDKVPSGACMGLSSQLSKNFAEIQVNGADVQNSSNGTSLDMANLAKLCGGAQNKVTLISSKVAQADMGEVPLPNDKGNKPPPPPVAPPTQGVQNVAGVSPVVYTPTVINAPTVLKTPTISGVDVSGTSVSQTSGSTSSGPPSVAFPPQTCFPSVVNTPVNTTEYNKQTLSCPAGEAGAITQQQSRTQTVTTTTTTTCANNWATPVVTTSSATTYGPYGPWSTISNTCAATCATQLAGGGYPTKTNYQWVTVNVGCPSGYSGTNSYQEQQVQTSTASCANPAGIAPPTYGPWSAWTNTGARQGVVNTCAPSAPPSAKAVRNCSVTGIVNSVTYGVLYANAPQGTTVIKTCQCPIELQNNGQTVTVYPSTNATSTGGGGYYGYSSGTVTVNGGTFTVGIMINGTSSETSSGTKWNSTCQASVLLPNGGHYP